MSHNQAFRKLNCTICTTENPLSLKPLFAILRKHLRSGAVVSTVLLAVVFPLIATNVLGERVADEDVTAVALVHTRVS
jgi:hypothetical protein